MGGVARAGLAVAALAAGLVASVVLARAWSPLCHEDCAPALQVSMWLFLLALPLAMAVLVIVATARPRPLGRVLAGLVGFVLLGIALTLVAAWWQGQARGK